MGCGLGLHTVDEGVGAKLEIHGLAHSDAEGRDEFGVGVTNRGDAEVATDHLRRAGDANRAAHEMNRLDHSRRDLLAYGIRDSLDAGAQDRGNLAPAGSLALFGLFDGKMERSSENEVEVMASAWLVAQRNEAAILHHADAGRSAAHVDDRSLADLQEGLSRRNLVYEPSTSHAGVLKDKAARPRLRLPHPRRI